MGPVSPLDDYVSELDAALRGTRRVKRELIQEARDHLVDATDAYETGGAPRLEAERRAVREFGDVRAIAPGYQAVLSASQGRRLGIWMLVAVLAQPFAWDLWSAIPPGANVDRSSWLFEHLDSYVEAIGTLSLGFALLGIVSCGIAVRFLGVREWVLRLALTSMLVSAALIVAISAAMLVAGDELTLVGAAYTALVAWLPMSALAFASMRALRGIDAVRDLAA